MLHEEGGCDSRIHQSIYLVSPEKDRPFLITLKSLPVGWVSQVHLSVPPNRHVFPREGQHACCGRCEDCCHCGKCQESRFDGGPPIDLRDVIELFPNTTDLTILWEVSDDGIHDFDSTHPGEKLRHLRRLRVDLRYDVYGLVNPFQQAEDTKMLLDHFCVSSLESIAIAFGISDEGQGCIDDMKATGNALCGIKAPALQRVTVSLKVPIWSEPVLEAWVSFCLLILF
jgi:hypothetical protein